ncbi:MAG: DMT family transporter [Candidatus Kerfeldbacteria bacterium]|nr:DMT family transporter [Candidatus Kerfeldbacteria bacterium]
MKQNFFHYATILALLAAAISGTNNFLTKVAVGVVGDPIVFTTLKNVLVAMALGGLVLGLKKWKEIKGLSRRQLTLLCAIGVVGGSVPFALYFTGLAQTSAINAGLIHKTLFLWVFLFAVPWLKEKVTAWQWMGVIVLFASNLLVGGFVGFRYNTGELMILAATVLWATENVIAKSVLRDVSSTTVAASRMILGSIILSLFIVMGGRGVALYSLTPEQWGWTILTSALLLGYVLSWYAALKRAPATYVAALLVPATLVTNLLSAVFVIHALTPLQAGAGALTVLGVALIIWFSHPRATVTPPRVPPAHGLRLDDEPSGSLITDGILRCARYAFGPNRLHYCGPDANREVASYLAHGVSDPGLAHLLSDFRTMYPYLKLIADSNHIPDPFDERVVEAYWIGNELLEAVSRRQLYRHLIDEHGLKRRLSPKSFQRVANAIGGGAVPHHSFHVFDIWRRTGHLDREHTLESLDECRISWGRVVLVDGQTLTVEREPLAYAQGKLFLAPPVPRRLVRRLESDYEIEQLKVGDLVTIHWGVPCEVVTPSQISTLKAYTLRHLKFANQTL